MKPVGSWRIRDSVGQALFLLLSDSEAWHHRKIESYRLLDGPRSRRQVSIDLTVPNDERLLIRSEFADETNQMLVPLALVKKATLQDFDASVGTSPMLIADTALNGAASLELLRTSWSFDLGRSLTDRENKFLESVVFSSGDLERPMVDAFLDEWMHRDPDGAAALSDETRALLGSLERCFLLIGLLPADMAGTHSIVKYSEHWELVAAERTNGFSIWGWLLASTGWVSASLEIDLNDAGLRPNSYHVEVHAPTGLLNEGLTVERLFVDAHSPEGALAEDSRHTSISHVAVRGIELPQRAYVDLGVATHGLLARAAIAYGASAGLFCASSFTAVAGAIFDPGARAATSLFLAVIAVLLGSLTRDAENPISSRFLLPLRIALIVLAALYFVAAASVAVGAGFDVGVATLRCGLGLTVAGAVVVVGGYFACRRRQV